MKYVGRLRFVGLVCGLSLAFGLGAMPAGADAPVKKDWTFIVWENVDNNLDEYGPADMNEMERVGSSERVNVVVVLDREKGPANKYYVRKDDRPDEVTSPVLQAMGEIDMGDWKLLVKEVLSIAKAFPARRYALNVSNHGSGWNRGRKRAPLLRGISYDDQSGNHITTAELGRACEAIAAGLGRKIDVLCMDACLMQMVEVAGEVRGGVDVVAASEESEPGDGYFYPYLLGPLVSKPTMSAHELGGTIVGAFAEANATTGDATTQSAVDCAQFPRFQASFEAWCNLLADKMGDGVTAAAIRRKVRPVVQSFDEKDNIDLGHFVSLVTRNVDDKVLAEAAAKVMACYAGGGTPLVFRNATTGQAMANASGLAIYFPTRAVDPAYATVRWSKTAWTRFLDAYLATAAKRR